MTTLKNLRIILSNAAAISGSGLLALPADASRFSQSSYSTGFVRNAIRSKVEPRVTVIGYTDEAGRQLMSEVEHATGQVIATSVISNVYTKDDHLDIPPFFTDAGLLIVLSTGHGAAANGGSSDHTYRLHISTTGRVANLVSQGTISNSFLDSNYVQLWQRGNTILAITCDDGGSTPLWAVMLSTDGGSSFTQRKAFLGQTVAPGGGQNQFYIRGARFADDRVLLFTIPHALNDANFIGLAELAISTGTVSKRDAAGVVTDYGDSYSTVAKLTPLVDTSAITKIVQVGAGRGLRLHDVLEDGTAFAVSEFDTATGANAVYAIYTLTSGANPYNTASWTRKTVTSNVGPRFWSSNYFPGLVFAREPHSGIRLYVTRRNTDGTMSYFERLDSSDSGNNWVTTNIETSNSLLARPTSAVNASPDFPVFYQKLLNYTHYNDWEGVIKWPRSRLDPATVAYLDRCTTSPGALYQSALNTLFVDLAEADFLRGLDTLYLLAAHSDQAHLLNLVSPNYSLTKVGSPDFLAERGSKSVSSAYYDTGFDPTTALNPKFTQNSGMLFAYQIEAASNGGSAIGWRPGTGSGASLATRSGANTSGRINSTAARSVAEASGVGLFAIRRSGTAISLTKGGVVIDSGTTASEALVSGTFKVLTATGSAFQDAGRIAFAGSGAFMTAGRIPSANYAMTKFLTAIGAI